MTISASGFDEGMSMNLHIGDTHDRVHPQKQNVDPSDIMTLGMSMVLNVMSPDGEFVMNDDPDFFVSFIRTNNEGYAQWQMQTDDILTGESLFLIHTLPTLPSFPLQEYVHVEYSQNGNIICIYRLICVNGKWIASPPVTQLASVPYMESLGIKGANEIAPYVGIRIPKIRQRSKRKDS